MIPANLGGLNLMDCKYVPFSPAGFKPSLAKTVSQILCRHVSARRLFPGLQTHSRSAQCDLTNVSSLTRAGCLFSVALSVAADFLVGATVAAFHDAKRRQTTTAAPCASRADRNPRRWKLLREKEFLKHSPNFKQLEMWKEYTSRMKDVLVTKRQKHTYYIAKFSLILSICVSPFVI